MHQAALTRLILVWEKAEPSARGPNSIAPECGSPASTQPPTAYVFIKSCAQPQSAAVLRPCGSPIT